MAATEGPLDPAWLAENKGPTVIIFLCVFTPVAWLFCCMRMYTRGIIMGKLRLDDGFCTMSVVSINVEFHRLSMVWLHEGGFAKQSVSGAGHCSSAASR